MGDIIFCRYAFGGFNGQERLSTVEVYDPELQKWSQGKTMMCKRSAVGVAALDDFIYVCGGYDGITSLSTVEQFCPKNDSWKKVASMMKYRSAGGVAALRGYIYALGGHDGVSDMLIHLKQYIDFNGNLNFFSFQFSTRWRGMIREMIHGRK